ncbi:MAG: hypothetical protein OER91_04905 [Gammaproteobacteria bacterium]|nr:hypothetical protein [Gammaproteobacteria bacterium]
MMCIAAYPFIILLGLKHLPPSFFGIVLLAVLGLRFGVLMPEERPVLIPVLLVYVAYAVTATVSGSQTMLLYYPAVVSFTMCGVFLNSLRQGNSMLLRLMKARKMELDEHAPPYLYWLTAIWAGFFVINGLVSIWTSTLTLEVWTLYNGFLSYCLVALLFGVEYVYRGYYRRSKRNETP